MPRLTVQVNEGNQPALGIEVIIQLAQPDRFRTSGAQVDNRPITAHTNLQGLAVFDLPASTEYVGQSLYSVRVAKSKPVSFAMPAQDRTLNQILGSPSPTIPGNLPSAGTYAQATSPPNPAPGTIWFDTSQVPPLGQWWDGTTWNDLAASAGGGLNRSQVDARVAAGVADWAEEGNTDDIPADKLGNVPDAGLDTAAVDARIKDFARTGGRVIQTADIGNVQITNQKIAGATLDNRVMANDAIDTDNIQDDAVTRAKIADDAIDADRIAAGAVGGAAIANDSITNSKLANDTLTDQKMASSVTDQFVPGGGTTGQVLKKRSNTAYDTEWAADQAGTGGGGLTQSQVDARIAQFARAGNTDLIPQAKLASAGAVGDVLKRTASGQQWAADEGLTQAEVDARVQAGVKNYAEQGNTADKIPQDDLATAVIGRLVPAGGTDNQILAKSADADYATEWIDAPTGGGDGASPVVASPVESIFTPSLAAGTRSAVGETQINIAASSINSNHPLSVSSNGIVVAAGTTPFQAMLDYVLEIDPTGWTNALDSGGNRLFFDIYWKKDGVILPDSRSSHYIRGDEDWAPSVHKIHSNVTEILSPGTYTLWFYRSKAAGGGNEINAFQINGTNSDIKINSQRLTGGTLQTSSVNVLQAFMEHRDAPKRHSDNSLTIDASTYYFESGLIQLPSDYNTKDLLEVLTSRETLVAATSSGFYNGRWTGSGAFSNRNSRFGANFHIPSDGSPSSGGSGITGGWTNNGTFTNNNFNRSFSFTGGQYTYLGVQGPDDTAPQVFAYGSSATGNIENALFYPSTSAFPAGRWIFTVFRGRSPATHNARLYSDAPAPVTWTLNFTGFPTLVKPLYNIAPTSKLLPPSSGWRRAINAFIQNGIDLVVNSNRQIAIVSNTQPSSQHTPTRFLYAALRD